MDRIHLCVSPHPITVALDPSLSSARVKVVKGSPKIDRSDPTICVSTVKFDVPHRYRSPLATGMTGNQHCNSGRWSLSSMTRRWQETLQGTAERPTALMNVSSLFLTFYSAALGLALSFVSTGKGSDDVGKSCLFRQPGGSTPLLVMVPSTATGSQALAKTAKSSAPTQPFIGMFVIEFIYDYFAVARPPVWVQEAAQFQKPGWKRCTTSEVTTLGSPVGQTLGTSPEVIMSLQVEIPRVIRQRVQVISIQRRCCGKCSAHPSPRRTMAVGGTDTIVLEYAYPKTGLGLSRADFIT
ncbi:hypothetical protein DFH06DRAFT_1445683 [Mycena polygramma]|nr:hypothetical protein DFH06DRAFT_1445683 [Mycena polygramma]